jgi:hypothetical protein
MNLLSVSWDIRSLWMILPLLSKICLVFLFASVLFTIVAILTNILWVNSSDRLERSADRVANLRQFQILAFYFFGACLADHFFAALQSIDRSKMSLQAEGVDAFSPLAWFAFIGFLTLLFSHSLQWFASCRVISVSQRNGQDTHGRSLKNL